MNATPNGVLNIMGAIVTVALVTTIVRSPNTANVVKAIGTSFSGAISAAMGAGTYKAH